MDKFPAWVDLTEMEQDARLDTQGRWVTCPANEKTHPLGTLGAKRKIIIRDDTLRSGGNTPGVYASREKKLRIADAIEQLGVSEAEVGYGTLKEDLEFVSDLRKRNTKMTLGMHVRTWTANWKKDIDAVADCGAHLCNLQGMQSYVLANALHPHLMGEAFISRVQECISHAKSVGLKASFGTDTCRPALLTKTVQKSMDAGLDRWVIYDSRGWYVPQTMGKMVEIVRQASAEKIEITLHAHDDFGLATANTLEGLRLGADGCDVTINRTGHRCGNAGFEQIAVGADYFLGFETGIDLKGITAVSKLVSDLYGVPVAENAPIVGHNMFSYGGTHIPGILRGDWFLWENLKAETVGSERHITYGPTALQAGVLEAKAANLGLNPNEAQMKRVSDGLRELLDQKKFATDDEVEAIISRVMS